MKIAANDFVKRQTPESRFSHFDGTWEELSELTEKCFDHQRQGYRDGVILVSVPPTRFYSSILEVSGDLDFEVSFEPRAEGEDPILFMVASGADKTAAVRAEVVLYRRDVLEEDGDCSTDAEWEIVSVNASPCEEEVPMDPMTRARNILHLKGGTDARIEDLNKEELVGLVKTMAEETFFWNTHVHVGDKK